MPAGEEQSAFVLQFVDEDLGNAAHLVGSRGARVAAMIDPLRDVDRYLEAAKRLGVQVVYALDTHLHNDFVSGSLEIAARTGAVVGASAEAEAEFEHRLLKEGDRLPLGDLALGVMATPGHTPEHIAFTMSRADAGRPLALFSGGALIVGGAARTDLLGHDLSVPLARQLYRTIHAKLLALPDDVAVYPTHGAGSFCAAPTVSDRTTTIGRERATNPLARAEGEDVFVEIALRGLPSYPVYFGKLRPVNRRGPRVLGRLPELPPLSAEEVRAWIDGGGAVLDVRSALEFHRGHIPGAYGIAVDAPLVVWGGWLIPFGTPLVLVTRGLEDREEAVRQLLLIGYDDLRGYLEGGMEAWRAAGYPLEEVRKIAPSALREQLATGKAPVVLDVRQEDEWRDGHIPGAVHLENGRLPWDDLPLPRDQPIVVHCYTRNRSTAGISVLARRGYRNLFLLDGGFAAWEKSGFEIKREAGPA